MSNTTAASREFAKNLKPGEYRLTNQHLREIYGFGRVTTRSRTQVAQELRRAGLEVLTDPAQEPLVVRKTAPARARVGNRGAPRWWSRPKLIGAAAFVLFLWMVGSLSLMVSALSSKEQQAPSARAAIAAAAPASTEPVAEATPTAPVETIADANEAVEDRDYGAALLIAAALGEDDEARVGRRIAGHLAKRVRKALRSGDRSGARSLLAESRSYPQTSEVRQARLSYKRAQAAAQRRAEARRIARAEARRKAREARAARRRAREAARALEAAPTYDAPASEAPSTTGPSSVNWCGKRDGDGDGVYCE